MLRKGTNFAELKIPRKWSNPSWLFWKLEQIQTNRLFFIGGPISAVVNNLKLGQEVNVRNDVLELGANCYRVRVNVNIATSLLNLFDCLIIYDVQLWWNCFEKSKAMLFVVILMMRIFRIWRAINPDKNYAPKVTE